MKKHCTKCKLEKDYADFYKDSRTQDGLYSCCKPCHLARFKKAGTKKTGYKLIVRNEEYRAYRRKILHDWRKANPDLLRASRKRWKKKKKEKFKAQRKLYDAISRKKIIRQPCEICGKENANAHHDDYSKPLDVRWLCPLHHRHEHLKPNPSA